MPYLSIAKNINKLLGGGINRRLLTLVYGEGGSGKTRFCMHACNQANGKACYIDTEGVSGELLALLRPERTVVYRAKTIEEQDRAVESAANGRYNIVVVDSLTNNYRRVLADANYRDLNNRIAEQLETLAQYSRLNDCPVLITTQMTGDRGLGGGLLDRIPVWIRLARNGAERRMEVERCPFRSAGAIEFRITSTGIEEQDQTGRIKANIREIA